MQSTSWETLDWKKHKLESIAGRNINNLRYANDNTCLELIAEVLGKREVFLLLTLLANIRWIIEKARECQKNIYFCFINYAKAFDCVDHNKLWRILQEMGIPDHLTCLLKICMQIKKQQLELDMEQQTGSK